jgi:hypothetical protein
MMTFIRLSLLIGFGFVQLTAQQNPSLLFEKALDLQNKGDLEGARSVYLELIKDGYTDEALYHNLALISVEKSELGKAVLYYERCVKHVSGADVCMSNLHELRGSIESYQVSFASVRMALRWNSFVSNFSSSFWGIIAMVFMLISGLLFYYRKRMRISWSYSIPLLVSFIFLITAFRRHYLETTNDFAIVTTPGIELSQGPDPESKLLYPLQEGTRVRVIGSDGHWKRVLLLNRDIGWLKQEVLETI